MNSVSRESPLPLYYQIRKNIEREILEGTLVPGEKLPSEDQLAASFGVSRMTVRRAIDQLVSRGLLSRLQGQGTFVAERQPQQKPVGITRWSFERIDQSQDVRQAVLQVEKAPPSLRVTHALHTMPGEMVVRITRILLLEDEPLGYCIDCMPELIVSTIEDWDLANDTLPDFLAKRCALEFGKVVERVRAVFAEEDAVELLGVVPGSPLLYVDSLVFLASGIPVILSDTTYRGDRYVYRGLLHPLLEDHND